MNIFERAARGKYRFQSNKGNLTTEQLFDLNLNELDVIAQAVDRDLQAASTTKSFVNRETTNPVKVLAEGKLDILKHIIEVKIAQQDAAAERIRKGEQRRALLDALAAKKADALTSGSIDELEKKLAELDA